MSTDAARFVRLMLLASRAQDPRERWDRVASARRVLDGREPGSLVREIVALLVEIDRRSPLSLLEQLDAVDGGHDRTCP